MLDHLTETERRRVWQMMIWAGLTCTERAPQLSPLLRAGMTAAVIYGDKEQTPLGSLLAMIMGIVYAGVRDDMPPVPPDALPSAVKARMPETMDAMLPLMQDFVDLQIEDAVVDAFIEEVVPSFVVKATHRFDVAH